MTPTLVFKRGALGREIISLGEVAVGEIAPYHGQTARATFMLRLPECARSSFRPAVSIEAARKIVAGEVSEWLLRAGVFYPGQLIDFVVTGAEVE